MPPAAAAYKRSFIREVHQLLAAGYARLTASTLARKEETSITGLLVETMREAINGPVRLAWAWRYAVHDDRPLSTPSTEGRDRARIDIEVERTMPGPHPRFQFEAKRLYRGDSVAEYVGPKGLGAFLDNTYAASCGVAGMLGYVQNASESQWAAKIEAKLDEDRTAHRIATGISVWKQIQPYTGATLLSYRSTHARSQSALDVFHTLLRCF